MIAPRGSLRRAVLALLAAHGLLGGAAAAQCVGDCNGDERVAVGELITGVNIALRERPLEDCPQFDRGGNGRVEIAELLTAVNAALGGCPVPACTSLAPLTPPCCTEVPATPVPEPDADCPQGRVLGIGRNTDGSFGRLADCDFARMFVGSQSGGGTLRFNVEVRCMRTSTPLKIYTQVETANRGMFIDDTRIGVFFRRRADGYYERLAHQVAIPGAPYFDLEDAEANLHVTVEDEDGATVSQSLRVRLTSTPLPELP